MIRFLRAMVLFARRARFVATPDWTPADAVALERFLKTPAGIKLRMVLAAQIAQANERAAMKATPFECGWACGYRGLWAIFQFLAQAGADSGESGDAEPGMAAGTEQYHP